METLRDTPETWALAPESRSHPESIRQVLFKTPRGRTYRALFAIRDCDVFVLHVRGPGQALLRPDELI